MSLHRALLGIILLSAPSVGWAFVGDTDEAFGANGSIRTIGAVSLNYDNDVIFGAENPTDGQAQSLLRLVLGGRPTEFITYEVHLLENVTLVTGEGTTNVVGAGNGVGATPRLRYRSLDTLWRQSTGDVMGSLDADRFNLKISGDRVAVTLGRQAITLGKAYFWNPLDVYSPFLPFQFDRDYKAGVDAARVDVYLGDFSGLTIVGTVGRGQQSVRWYRSSILVRAYGTVGGWDLAVQLGKIFAGYQVGGAASGELGPLAFRGELAYFRSQSVPDRLTAPRPPDAVSAVVGVGHRFESSLHIEAEYFFNHGGRVPRLEGFTFLGRGQLLNVSKHVLGANVSYELTPLLRGSFAALVGAPGTSALFQPGLIYSAGDEVELLAGAVLVAGPRPTRDPLPDLRSEYGTYPHVFYMETKIYF